MATPTSRETFKEYCLRTLGKPVVDINVDDQQVEDRIDDALQYYRDYHFDGTERIIKKIEITQTIKDNKQKQDALSEIIPPEHFYGDDFLRHLPIRHKSVDDGIKKLIDNGIIVVGSARNSSLAVDVPGGVDYDNKISRKIFGDFYLNRGSSPGCSPGIITVSSLHRGGNGPRIDYFEDGSDTLTSVKYRTVGSAIKDFRSDNHEVAYVEGTSVATAKITGRLALELEKNPNLSQNEARTILNKNKNGNAV